MKRLPLALVALVFLGSCGDSPETPAPVAQTPAPADPAAGSAPAPAPDDPELAPPARPPLVAGAGASDITPGPGVPLGGYGARRSGGIELDPSTPVTFFKPAAGVRDPLACRALYLGGDGAKVGFLAVDAIAVSGDIVAKIAARQAALGGQLATSDLLVFASHTHSGSGASAKHHLWEHAAMDLHVPAVENVIVEGCAKAIADAQASARPAKIGSRTGHIPGVTKNRRAGTSPHVTAETVDDEVALLRVDGEDGAPIAALWNFGIHGTALGASNLRFSADVMGAANDALAKALPGVTFLFANGAEGDIAPTHGGEEGMLVDGAAIAEAVAKLHAETPLDAAPKLVTSSAEVAFPEAEIVISESAAGDIDLGALGSVLGGSSGARLSLDDTWIEKRFRFQAVRVGDHAAFVSLPGEAVHELGLALKGVARKLGARDVFPVGLANGHMGYITTPREFDAGGYEALMTFFGRDTGTKVESACTERLAAVLGP